MPGKLKSYRDLAVWQKAIDLILADYHLTSRLPAKERYGLVSQMQRAAVSIPANIAEGYARRHRGDYVHHLSIARGSLAELETYVTIVGRLGYVKREEALRVWSLSQEVRKMLGALSHSLEPVTKPGQTPNPKP